jgi:glycosyltransferase involved in cell wall biosynthesis
MRRGAHRPRGSDGARVLQFVNSFHLGGTEGQVVELLRGLAGRYRASAAVIRAEGAHLPAVQALGIQPAEFGLSGSVLRPGTAWQVMRLARHVASQGIDLVHAQDFYSTLVGVPGARLGGAKVVVNRLDLAHWLTPSQRIALALATRAADRVVVNARAIREQLVREERLPWGRISVIPNGIDLARFDRQRRGALEAPIPEVRAGVRVAHVANMNHSVKAQEDALEAMAVLARRRGPRAELFFIGDGPRRGPLEELAKKLGVEDRAHFLGRREDVPAILARAQIGLLCSRAEGLSNAVIEMMAAGLPVVVTDAGGNRELVRHGERGLVVPVGAPRALAEAMAELAASKALRLRMGAAGRAFVERELGLERLVRRHDALYRALLDGCEGGHRTRRRSR